MLRLTSEVIIANDSGNKVWRFSALHACEITADTETLTDTCTLTLPKKINWQGLPVGTGANVAVKRGDKVSVAIGYDGELENRFVGYVRLVHSGTPVKIDCEDSMYKLKLAKLSEKKSFKHASLKLVIEHLLTGTGFNFLLLDDMALGNYRITQETVAAELNELQKEYKIKSYFRTISGRPVLYVGLTYPLDHVATQKFIHAKRIVNEALEYKRKEDVLVRVKATSAQFNNSSITVELGDNDGELIEVSIAGISKEQLTSFAQKTLDNAKYEGLRGSFTAFGEPLVHKTDKVYLETADGLKGTYLVKKVDTVFDTSGFKQTIALGQIVNTNE
jgi:hypothetical protein